MKYRTETSFYINHNSTKHLQRSLLLVYPVFSRGSSCWGVTGFEQRILLLVYPVSSRESSCDVSGFQQRIQFLADNPVVGESGFQQRIQFVGVSGFQQRTQLLLFLNSSRGSSQWRIRFLEKDPVNGVSGFQERIQ